MAILTPNNNILRILSMYKSGVNSFMSFDYDLAYDQYEKINDSMLVRAGVTEVHPPSKDKMLSASNGRDVFVVKTNLTNMGEGCYATLKRGCCWNIESCSFDPLATEDWYEGKLKENQIDEEIFDFIERVDDIFLKPIKHKLIAFKLQSTKIFDGDKYFYTIKEGDD
jgi:hypothetical protein